MRIPVKKEGGARVQAQACDQTCRDELGWLSASITSSRGLPVVLYLIFVSCTYSYKYVRCDRSKVFRTQNHVRTRQLGRTTDSVGCPLANQSCIAYSCWLVKADVPSMPIPRQSLACAVVSELVSSALFWGWNDSNSSDDLMPRSMHFLRQIVLFQKYFE